MNLKRNMNGTMETKSQTLQNCRIPFMKHSVSYKTTGVEDTALDSRHCGLGWLTWKGLGGTFLSD